MVIGGEKASFHCVPVSTLALFSTSCSTKMIKFCEIFRLYFALFFLAVTLYFFVCFFNTNRCIILKHCELGILPGKNEMTRRTLQRGQHLSLMETEESLGDIIASPLRGGDGGGVVIRISCLFHRSILSHWQTCCFNDMMQTT